MVINASQHCPCFNLLGVIIWLPISYSIIPLINWIISKLQMNCHKEVFYTSNLRINQLVVLILLHNPQKNSTVTKCDGFRLSCFPFWMKVLCYLKSDFILKNMYPGNRLISWHLYSVQMMGPAQTLMLHLYLQPCYHNTWPG